MAGMSARVNTVPTGVVDEYPPLPEAPLDAGPPPLFDVPSFSSWVTEVFTEEHDDEVLDKVSAIPADDDMAKINMRTVVDSSVKGCVGELIDIASGEEIDKAFETINAIVGGHLQVQQY